MEKQLQKLLLFLLISAASFLLSMAIGDWGLYFLTALLCGSFWYKRTSRRNTDPDQASLEKRIQGLLLSFAISAIAFVLCFSFKGLGVFVVLSLLFGVLMTEL